MTKTFIGSFFLVFWRALAEIFTTENQKSGVTTICQKQVERLQAIKIMLTKENKHPENT